MAQNTSLLAKTCRPKRSPYPALTNGAWQEAKRAAPSVLPDGCEGSPHTLSCQALQLIYEIALQELGNRIASAVVQASTDPDDPDQIRLLLSIWADLDKREWHEADKAISKAVFEQEATWTEDEKADYLKMIDFEILPLKI